MPLRRAAVLLALVCSACAQGPAPVLAERFAQTYAQAVCAAQARCVSAASFVEEQCQQQILDAVGQDVTQAIAAGRLRYDAQEAGLCVDAAAHSRCVPEGLVAPDPVHCLRALQGTVQPGEACHSEYECAQGLCDMGATCPGVCPHVLHDGDACNAHAEPSCDVREDLTCSQAVCHRISGSGGACSLNSDCSAGLLCVDGTCSGLRRAGAGCSADESCAPGLYCEGGGDEDSGVCIARRGEGSPCGADDEDAPAAERGAQCAQGLVCRGAGLDNLGAPVAGTCTSIAQEGEACAAEPDGLQWFLSGCADGLVCVNGTCAPEPASGACAPHETCRRHVAFCDQGTCAPFHEVGQPCDNDVQCDPWAGRFCIQGVCMDEAPLCHER